VITIILLLPINLHASGWQTASNVLLVADWAQTLHISENDEFYETNNILGRYPSRGSVNTYFIAAIILNNYIGSKAGDGWYMVVTVNQALYVGHNISAGVEFNF
jgi:hypothetical protein